MKFLEGYWIFSSQLNHLLNIYSELPSSLWMQPWSYPDATCSCSSSSPYPTSDKPVYIQLLLEDLLVGHSSNIMHFQGLCIFHSCEGMSNYIAACLLLLYKHRAYRICIRLTRHRKLLLNCRNASIRMNLLSVVTTHLDSYVYVYRSFSKLHNSLSCAGFKSLQCAAIRHSSQQFANYRRDSSIDRPLSLDMQIS